MAETTLPEPLVPAEVDLRDFPFTPMFRARLFGSAFHAEASDAEWRAGLTLWLKSWDQVPAGTLPKGDVELCRLAELGRDHRTWKRLRAAALRGWIECADGRLHHRVVAEGVLEAWKQKMDQRVRTTKARIAKIEIRLRKERDPIEKSRLQAMVDALRADLKRYATCSVAESVTDDVSDAATDRATDDAIDDVTDAETDRATESVTGTKRREGKRREEIRSNLASGDKSPSAAAKAREDALCQPAGISDGDLADSVETVFSAVARSAESWFDAVERDRHDGDEAVIRGWLELAGSAGLSDADAVQAIAEAIDRQFERLSKRPRVGMPVSLELIDKDVRAAISAARRNPSKVADEARAPEPYAARFTATQWTTWLKPCTVTVADGIATITAPTMVIADRLRVHHDQDLRVCLDVGAVEVVAAPRRKGTSATIIPHPATVAEVSK